MTPLCSLSTGENSNLVKHELSTEEYPGMGYKELIQEFQDLFGSLACKPRKKCSDGYQLVRGGSPLPLQEA